MSTVIAFPSSFQRTCAQLADTGSELANALGAAFIAYGGTSSLNQIFGLAVSSAAMHDSEWRLVATLALATGGLMLHQSFAPAITKPLKIYAERKNSSHTVLDFRRA